MAASRLIASIGSDKVGLRHHDHRHGGHAAGAARKILHRELFDTCRRSSWLTKGLAMTDGSDGASKSFETVS